MAYAAGDIINFDFTGAAQTVQLPPGRYKLEVWGAQGGSYSSYYGGAGGYSVGTIAFTADTLLYIYVGGQPAANSSNRVTVSGGFNGGGNGYNRQYKGTYTYGQGGGGGTDIRIGQDSLYARVIVAGGGGGSASVNALTTKYGGGTTGGAPTSSYAGTQTTGGSAGNTGSFGKGGSVTTGGYNYKYSSGGGGGGWYGGGAASSYTNRSSSYRGHNGGGSGFVWTGENAPSGYLLGEEYYLTDAQTIAGNTSFTAPDGTEETGHRGNGYARITVLEIYTFGPDTPANFRQDSQDYFSIGLAWDAVDADGYRLYKDGDLLADQTATTYTDSGMMPDEGHTYTLIAYNADGESDPASLTAKTKFAYYVIQPFFQSASFSVNPADMNGKTILTVSVTDEMKILEPETWYSGELYSGEV